MNSNNCPICKKCPAKSCQGNFDFFECDDCRGVYIDSRLVRAPTTLDDWSGPLCAARELREQTSWPATIQFDGSVTAPVENNREIVVTTFPATISARANKLLSALVRRSKCFGAGIRVTLHDYPLAYVTSYPELHSYIDFLEENGFVSVAARHTGGVDLKVKARGFDAVESASLLSPLSVFLSSTCHDLRDCRCELTSYIESLGCIVRASDDPLKFDVSATDNSIESCLLNVQNSDVVFCLIDQRYGPPLPEGDYKDISATHAEVRFARARNIPVYFFIRRDAFAEWSILKRDPTAKTNWVEPTNQSRRELWVAFVSEYAVLPSEKGISNWFDQFNSVVDLKQIMSSRIRQIQSRLSTRTKV